MRQILLFALASVFLFSCGRKENPRPPEETAPSSVQFLTVVSEVDAIVLRWEAPTTNAKGDPLIDLAGFAVKRRELEKDEEVSFELLKRVMLPQFKKDDPKAAEPKMTKFAYRDEEVQPGKRYEYIVVPINESRVEGVSSTLIRVTFIGETSVIETLQLPT